MSTVWVTQETGHDIRQAERWGDIKFVSGRDFLSIKNSQVNEDILDRIQAAAIEVDPATDWVLITGSPYIASMFVAQIIATNTDPQGCFNKAVNFLRWSNRDGQYYPLTLAVR